MSPQGDLVVANANGATFRSDMNDQLMALGTLSSGSSAPGTAYAHQLWADTSTNKLKIRNGANNAWLEVGDLTAANLALATAASPTFSGTVTSGGDLTMSGTGKLKLPAGTTAQRPTAVTGAIRFNTSLTLFEGYNGTDWDPFGAGAPVGAVIAVAGSSTPTGYLACNGAAVSRSAYADLYQQCGTTYGSGDGSSTFNVPDLRGYFIRGWNAGGGNAGNIDSGRNIGSIQNDQNKEQTHTIDIDDPGHKHEIYGGGNDDDGGPNQTGSNDTSTLNNMGNATTGITADAQDQGGTEVRVKNIAMYYVIKY